MRDRIKKTVLLTTIWDNQNFGNRLQAIALKHLIENLGFDVVCVLSSPFSYWQRVKNVIKGALGLFGVRRYRESYLKDLRRCALRKSCNMYLSPTTRLISCFDVRNRIKPEDYDAAITGSDQVWHKWHNEDKELLFYYLSFMPHNKRISYAASFGFEEFPETDKEVHRNGLQGMRLISCREISGCRLVEQMTGTCGELVLDPTICVEKEFWDTLEERPSWVPDKPFLLLYFLGNKYPYEEVIKQYRDRHNLYIVDLFEKKNTNVWNTSIGEFIWLIHHAEMVCTDSFHCTVFSILYEKPFQVFKRCQIGFENMYNRIETLLLLTKLEETQFDGRDLVTPNENFLYAKQQIEIERERSIKWLKYALDEVVKTQ